MVYQLYNLGLTVTEKSLPLLAHITKWCKKDKNKLQRFVEYQQESLVNSHKKRPAHTIWIHVASLGEYAITRPLISRLKSNGYYVVLTFFSPTGYESLKTFKKKDADEILFLPIDTRHNAKLFIETIRPRKAIFAVSELWVNHLQQLHEHQIPTFLVSAKITPKTAAMRWYGNIFLQALKRFEKIMVLDEASQKLLQEKGLCNVVRTGDMLFDNAKQVAAHEYGNEIIEKFCHGHKVFIAGSISDEKDLELVSHLANKKTNTKFIFVPHEISEEGLNNIKSHLLGKSVLYSECTDATDFDSTQVLIIDFIGALAYIYRFCTYAYVGGGFTPYLHSIIEPLVYGIPMAFGPVVHRKNSALELKELGIAEIVRDKTELLKWFDSIEGNEIYLQKCKQQCQNYVEQNANATSAILNIILDEKH